MSRFQKISHVIWHCQYHWVWVPKYRLRVLRGWLVKRTAWPPYRGLMQFHVLLTWILNCANLLKTCGFYTEIVNPITPIDRLLLAIVNARFWPWVARKPSTDQMSALENDATRFWIESKSFYKSYISRQFFWNRQSISVIEIGNKDKFKDWLNYVWMIN